MRVLLLVGAFVAVSTLAEAQALRILPRVEVEHAEPFTRVAGVRELRDGRVIVLDAQDQSIHLVNLATRTASPIGRQGDGPGEFRLPLRILALPNDSSLVEDMARPNGLLVITPDGRAGGLLAANNPALGTMAQASVAATDAQGRLYGRTFAARVGGDSVDISRFDASARRWEPVARMCPKVVSMLREVGRCGAASAAVPAPLPAGIARAARPLNSAPEPYTTVDQWAVAPDGRVAVVSVDPYFVTFFQAGRPPVAGPRIPVAPTRLTEGHRAAWRRERELPVAMVSANRNGTTTSSYQRRPVQEPAEWPTHLPPFLPGALAFAPDGTLWVQRTTADASAPPTYDLIGPVGTVTSQLVLPARTRLVGFGAGTIYLVRIDEDDLEYLQRYRMP